MTQGTIPALSALTLTAAEKVSGYTSNPTQGGPDVNEMLQGAILDMEAAAIKLNIVNNVLPAGANKTTLVALLAAMGQSAGTQTLISNVRELAQAGVAESGNATSGWTYTSSAADGSYSGSQGLVSAAKIPSGSDGWFALQVENYSAASSAGFHVGVKTTQALGAFSTTAVGVYQSGGAGSAYRISTGGSTATNAVGRNAQNNDILRVRRAGTTIVVEISSDNGATFQAIQFLSGQSTGDLYLQIVWGGNGVTAANLQMGVTTYDAATLAFWAGANVVWDGNSLVAGAGATVGTNDLPTQVLLSNQVPTDAASGPVNVAIAGQTWEQMTSAATDVDGAWVAGKTNVLILWETTNSVFIGADASSGAIAAATAYIAARRALHPWIIVCLTTLPRAGGVSDIPTRTALNNTMSAVDAYMMSNTATMGLDAVVNVRQAGSPFALPDYTNASFDAIQSLWNEGDGQQIHCSPAGYAVIAGYVVSALSNMPRTVHQ